MESRKPIYAGFLALVLASGVLISCAKHKPADVTPVQPAASRDLTIVIVEGEGAINNVRQRTVREPTVQVEDKDHRPVSGSTVAFSLPASGAGGAFANGAKTFTAVTDQQGRAVARGFNANASRGAYKMQVTASSAGLTATAEIHMANVSAGAGAGAGAGAPKKARRPPPPPPPVQGGSPYARPVEGDLTYPTPVQGGSAYPPQQQQQQQQQPPTAARPSPEPEIPAFDWPPPTPSAREVLPPDLLSRGHNLERLGDVDQVLIAALSSNSYERSYFSVPNGFAIVSRLEQISENGAPLPNPARWSVTTSTGSGGFSLASYLRAIFTADPGYFRIIVFIVTDVSFAASGQPVSQAEAKEWLERGGNKLPESIAGQPYTRDVACTALIYEFEHKSDRDPIVLQPSPVAAHDHLVLSGLWRSLGGQ